VKVLFISPEVGPIVRAGGLGDVVGALPLALKQIGIDVRILCPLHRECKNIKGIRISPPIQLKFASKSYSLKIREVKLGQSEIPVYLLENKFLFDRPGIYSDENGNYPDNPLRCFILSKSSLHLEKVIGWSPDIFHCHDWMTAPLPAYLNELNKNKKQKKAAQAKSVLTIHNLEHQGSFPEEVFPISGLPRSFYGIDGFNHYGRMNLLKGAIQHAHKITTVSPTYAKEIRTQEYGENLETSLQYRGADLIGILNGIDQNNWNPETDSSLNCKIHSVNPGKGKYSNKISLLKEMGLPVEEKIPLFGVVSRLYHQKGLDILLKSLPELLVKNNFQIVLLGNGDPALENSFRELASKFRKKISIHIGFNDGLARRIFAGSDFFVMPSRFEPCGLAQQYAMKYGSIPVARKTGGLADTIIDVDTHKERANGLLFEQISSNEMKKVVHRAIKLFQIPELFEKIRENGMNSNFSWDIAAQKYGKVYEWALNC
jgi:starch synthase